MITLLVWVVLIGGYVWTYRKVYPVAMDLLDMGGGYDKTDRGFAAVLSLIVCLMWPLVLIGYALYTVATPITPKEREAELRERERKIADMERELGLGPYKKDGA